MTRRDTGIRQKMSSNLHMSHAYIYLIQDGNDVGTNIYKVGRTVETGKDKRKLCRLESYDAQSVVYYVFEVDIEYVMSIETQIKNLFKTKFELARGHEWFAGDKTAMRKVINSVIDVYEEEIDENGEEELPNISKHPPNNTLAKRIKPPYTCPRCGYATEDKSKMRRHYDCVKVCCGLVDESLVLTDEIKACVLRNRVYHNPNNPQVPQPQAHPQPQAQSVTNNIYVQNLIMPCL